MHYLCFSNTIFDYTKERGSVFNIPPQACTFFCFSYAILAIPKKEEASSASHPMLQLLTSSILKELLPLYLRLGRAHIVERQWPNETCSFPG